MLATITPITLAEAVGLFIDQNFSYKILPEFNVSDANIIEPLFVEICIVRHKNIIIGVIYRPPSENTLEFVEKVNEIISGLTKLVILIWIY